MRIDPRSGGPGARRPLPPLVGAALLLAASLAGCAVPEPPPPGTTGERFVLGPVLPLPGGGPAREPHLAVRTEAGTEIVVTASYVYDPGDGPVEDYDTPELVVHRSLDGGASWSRHLLPRAAILAGREPVGLWRLADPVLAYDSSGTLFLAATAFQQGAFKFVPGAGLPVAAPPSSTAVLVTRSTDDGATWSEAVYWDGGAGPAVQPDKEWLAVGPDGALHLAYMRFEPHASRVIYVRSGDGGASWTEPRVVAEAGPEVSLHAPIVAAGPKGRVLLLATRYPPGSTGCVATGQVEPGGVQLIWASADGGRAFAGPVEVGEGNFCRWAHVAADPNDPGRGVVVGTSDAQDPGDARVWITFTRDGGATWTTPGPAGEARGGAQSHPSVWIDAASDVHVAYYDAGWPGGERLVRSTHRDGVLRFEEAGGDPLETPAFFRGEYFGLAGVGVASWAAWVGGDARTGPRLEVARAELEP